MSDVWLNVSAIRRRTQVNGPGWRSAVWVQGCTLRCKGCFNPETHPHKAREFWKPQELARYLMDSEVEGVSILGGEPFEQAEACSLLAQEVQRLGGTVVTYSGYEWSVLRESPLLEVQALLADTDLLIAGPFIASMPTDGKGWFGSENQEVIFLSDRYDTSIWTAIEDLPVIEVKTDGTHYDCTGIPSTKDIQRLKSLF